MIRVDKETVKAKGTLLKLIEDLANAMKAIREGALPENDERKIDELFYIAIELSKKSPEEITPEDEKATCEKVKERLS